MWRNKWIYIIGIDIILGIVLFSAGYFQELAFLFFTFYAMCASGILGILFLFFKRIRNIGCALLINLLILPFLFMAILVLGPDWQILGIDYDSDDMKNRFKENNLVTAISEAIDTNDLKEE